MQLSSFVIVDTTAEAPQAVLPQKRSLRALQNILVFGLFVLLAFGVLAFGAVDEWSTFAFEVGVAILFLVWAARQVISDQLKLSRNPLYLPAALFFLLILAQILLRTTAYSYVTQYEAMRYLSYGIVMLVAAEYVQEETVRKQVVLAMIAFGTAYTIFALVQELAANGKIFWLHRPQFGGGIFGSYVNRNHYAGLIEMLVPFPLVVSMGHLIKKEKRAIVGFCAILMASTIFLSRSRGGMIAFALQIVLFAVLTLWQRRNPRVAGTLAVVCLLVLIFLFIIGKGHVLGRLQDLAPGTRLTMTLDCLKLYAKRPVLGWGLGTFPVVYPKYRSFYTSLFINEAHNDYAQLLAEMGTLGFALMVWFLARLYRYRWASSRRWEFKWDGALSLAALLGCSGILLHSFVDFNLHIPGNAALFYALAAMAAANRDKTSNKGITPEKFSASELANLKIGSK